MNDSNGVLEEDWTEDMKSSSVPTSVPSQACAMLSRHLGQIAC